MEKEIFEGKWKQMKGQIQEKWGKLTGDEIDQMKGDYEVFVGKLTEKYGDTKGDLRNEINDFIKKHKDSNK